MVLLILVKPAAHVLKPVARNEAQKGRTTFGGLRGGFEAPAISHALCTAMPYALGRVMGGQSTSKRPSKHWLVGLLS
eukprot:s1531_g19.t1